MAGAAGSHAKTLNEHIDRARLRIGILHSSLGLVRGGIETIALQFALGLVEREHAVSVVVGQWPGRPLPTAVKRLPARVLRVPCLPTTLSAWPYLKTFTSSGTALKVQSLSFCHTSRWHADVRRVLQTADVTLSFFDYETVTFARWRRREGRPHVSYFSGAILLEWLQSDVSVMRLANSQTTAETYRRRAGLRIDGVVTPGVHSHWFDTAYHVRADPKTLLFVGRLEANKGIRELIRVFSAVASAMPNVELRLVGDGPLRPWVEKKCQSRVLTDRITLTGALPQEEVRDELQRADLFIFPSHYESFGIAVLEAMAVGVPVVCSDLPALQEVTGSTACRVPPNDTAAWEATIRGLLNDRNERERLSRAGRRRAREFTWSRTTDELETRLYEAASRESA